MKLSEKETNLYFKSSPVELLSVELEAKKYMPFSGMLKLLPMTTSEAEAKAVGMLIFSQSPECSEYSQQLKLPGAELQAKKIHNIISLQITIPS